MGPYGAHRRSLSAEAPPSDDFLRFGCRSPTSLRALGLALDLRRLPGRGRDGMWGNRWTGAVTGFVYKTHYYNDLLVVSNMFAPTRTLLHTYNHHYHHHHHHHTSSSSPYIIIHHHTSSYIIIHHHTSWSSSQHIKIHTPSEKYVDWVITSTLSSCGVKICHPLWTRCWLGVITSTLSSEGIKIHHPLWTTCWLGW